MEASLVSRMWSVRIQGMDISMGNWILRPMVSSRKNSLNQSWERSQHCCKVSTWRMWRDTGFIRRVYITQLLNKRLPEVYSLPLKFNRWV